MFFDAVDINSPRAMYSLHWFIAVSKKNAEHCDPYLLQTEAQALVLLTVVSNHESSSTRLTWITGVAKLKMAPLLQSVVEGIVAGSSVVLVVVLVVLVVAEESEVVSTLKSGAPMVVVGISLISVEDGSTVVVVVVVVIAGLNKYRSNPIASSLTSLSSKLEYRRHTNVSAL